MGKNSDKNLAQEMSEKTKSEEDMMERRIKQFIKKLPIFISLVTVLLLLVLYSFNYGYYKMYNISARCITVDIRDFLPVALQFCVIYIFLIFYFVQIKTDKIMQTRHPNFLRVFYGAFVLDYILRVNGNIENLMGVKATIAISIIIPAIMEVIWYLMKKPKKTDDKEYTEAERKILLTGMIENRILYLINGKYLMGIIVVLVLFASIWGRVCAKTENEYQIFRKGDTSYAVIII